MAKRRRATDETTKNRIVEAAINTLKREGYAGTSARAIAAAGGFSQAAIFYHFGTIHDLLLTALDAVSADRMRRYREAMQTVGDVSDLLTVAKRVFAEDIAAGDTHVLVEMTVAASTDAELGPRIIDRIEPWITLTEEAIRRGDGSPSACKPRSYIGSRLRHRCLLPRHRTPVAPRTRSEPRTGGVRWGLRVGRAVCAGARTRSRRAERG
jgi:AcrR family transcriptional regulator